MRSKNELLLFAPGSVPEPEVEKRVKKGLGPLREVERMVRLQVRPSGSSGLIPSSSHPPFVP